LLILGGFEVEEGKDGEEEDEEDEEDKGEVTVESEEGKIGECRGWGVLPL
jgi:major membrane immunogen (membrane-anchored lipoprotein)